MAKGFARPIIIKAKRANDKPHNVDFEMHDGSQVTMTLEFDKSKVEDMRSDDYHKVVFELHNTGNVNLEFVSTKADAMWAQKGTQCPKRRCPQLDEFKVIDVKPTELTVFNKNPCKEKIAFTLNFIKPGDDERPENFIPYDPIVENKNGGVQSDASLLKLAVSVAVVSTIALLSFRFLS